MSFAEDTDIDAFVVLAPSEFTEDIKLSIILTKNTQYRVS